MWVRIPRLPPTTGSSTSRARAGLKPKYDGASPSLLARSLSPIGRDSRLKPCIVWVRIPQGLPALVAEWICSGLLSRTYVGSNPTECARKMD